ncbi:MAG: DegT/DnrJ/EryC1/StrS family aminotransferase [Elusimicrobia bacterium]|nr:DegT/DnrJ/EryC1/StrS family aminotransferase [Elusimicrobiota bacterium]
MILPVSRRTVSLYPGEWLDIARLAAAGELVEGECERSFAARFARYVGVEHAVPTGTGRFALSAILRAMGPPPGGEVIMPAYEDLSVPQEVRGLGLVPVFADVSPESQGVGVQGVLDRMTDRTVAVVVAHLFGIAAGIDAIVAAARGRGVKVIEDCAHAVGTRRDGTHVGGAGDAAFFSFHSTKPFMTFGGGMAVTRDPELAARIRALVEASPYPSRADLLLRVLSTYALAAMTSAPAFPLGVFPVLLLLDRLGVDPVGVYDRAFRRPVSVARTDVRLANAQALVGLRQLDRVDGGLERRRANARALDAALGAGIGRPDHGEGGNRYFYIIFDDDAPRLRSRLLRRGVDTGRGLMRHCPAAFGLRPEDFPNTTRMLETSLQVPAHEGLTPRAMAEIAALINREAAGARPGPAGPGAERPGGHRERRWPAGAPGAARDGIIPP